MELKVLEKSRKLLIEVMGGTDFENFIENGKIEIKHGDITYELDQDARVYNRSTQQSYCIEPIASDNLPLHDQLAIKYSYLKNNIKRVEEVANKRSVASRVYTPVPYERQAAYGFMEADRTNSPSYHNYIEYMEGMGWSREQLSLDEQNIHLVSLNNVNVGNTGMLVDIQCPPGRKISIMGTQQVPRGADARTAHSVRARFADEEDNEIPLQTKIRITKEKTSDAVIQLARVFYADINITKSSTLLSSPTQFKIDEEWFRFSSGIEINGGDCLRVYAINTVANGRNIVARNSRFVLECDLWSM